MSRTTLLLDPCMMLGSCYILVVITNCAYRVLQLVARLIVIIF